MYQGVVKWFDSRETKRFGFIRLESGEEIFFHFNDGRLVEVRNNQVQFAESATAVRQGKTVRLMDPKPGDVIVFAKFPGSRGDKAFPWGYMESWERGKQWISDHKEEIAARQEAERQALANRPVYRVLETMNALGKEPGDPKVLWQGQDMEEVLRRFPLPHGRQSPSADPLLPYWGDNDNIFEVRHWWEMQQPDGSWQRCPDPRPLPGVLRQFETISRR